MSVRKEEDSGLLTIVPLGSIAISLPITATWNSLQLSAIQTVYLDRHSYKLLHVDIPVCSTEPVGSNEMLQRQIEHNSQQLRIPFEFFSPTLIYADFEIEYRTSVNNVRYNSYNWLDEHGVITAFLRISNEKERTYVSCNSYLDKRQFWDSILQDFNDRVLAFSFK